MNYQKIYNQLIEKRKIQILFKKETYCERHHIVPKCMNGSNEDFNLVNLTAREHFLAHWLLHRICPDNSYLANAFYRFTIPFNSKNRIFTPSSRAYEEARTSQIFTESRRKKMSVAKLNVKRSDEAKLAVSIGINNSEKFKLAMELTRGVKKPRGICEHCNKEFALNILALFHGDFCKENPNITKEQLDSRK